MTAAAITAPLQNALTIPRLTHAEAGRLAAAELQRVIALVETLDGDDWTQPTDCTEWTVREMVSHLAGGCAGSASFGEFFRQAVRNPYRGTEKIPVDAINRLQVEDRAGKPPAEIIAELRDVGPKAVRSRKRIPWIVRILPVIPFGPPVGYRTVGYLMDVIYPRDEWMHRADLCRATGKQMIMTAGHDDRIMALVLRELAFKLRRGGFQDTIDLALTGDVTLEYRFGEGTGPATAITLDILQFARLTSGRITPEAALNMAAVEGDMAAASRFFDRAEIPY